MQSRESMLFYSTALAIKRVRRIPICQRPILYAPINRFLGFDRFDSQSHRSRKASMYIFLKSFCRLGSNINLPWSSSFVGSCAGKKLDSYFVGAYTHANPKWRLYLRMTLLFCILYKIWRYYPLLRASSIQGCIWNLYLLRGGNKATNIHLIRVLELADIEFYHYARMTPPLLKRLCW